MRASRPDPAMAAASDDPFCGLDLDQLPERPRPGPFIASSLIALALIAGLAGVLVKVLVDDRRVRLHAAQGARMEAMRAVAPRFWPPGSLASPRPDAGSPRRTRCDCSPASWHSIGRLSRSPLRWWSSCPICSR